MAADPPLLDAQLLGFELEPVDGRPGGWLGGPAATIVSDAAVYHGGARSLRLQRDASSPAEFSFATRSVPLDFAGKTLELRGWLRREGAGVPSLWMRQDGTHGVLGFVDMKPGTDVREAWTEYSISFPRQDEARSLVIGVRLIDAGKAWADDLQLLVDGKPVSEAPKVAPVETVLDRDREFSAGSKLSLTRLTDRQLDTLVLTAKVWGFLKYHHPAVTGGKQHWDFALLRQLPKLLGLGSAAKVQQQLVAWIDSLGPVPACTSCVTVDPAWPVKPRLKWIEDTRLLGPQLRQRLRTVYAMRGSGSQFYVSLARNVSNPVFEHEPTYAKMEFPDAGFQILAVMRFWNMVEYWFPYRDLIDENWDAVLRDSLERIATAPGRDEYRREIAALVARADDGHANAGVARPPVGQCRLPVILQYVENQFVVRALTADEGVFKRGDLLTAIDGRPVAQIVADVRRYYGASNEPFLMNSMSRALAWGACGEAKVSVTRDAPLELAVQRVKVESKLMDERLLHDLPGATFQRLEPKVAYLKLSTIKQADVEKSIDSLAADDALIVDIRNYPATFVVFSLGRLLVDESTPFVLHSWPDLANPGAFAWGATTTLEPKKPHFGGRVAILVDETSISQAEYTTMALSASPRAIVVGSTTAGADGNVCPIPLPGNVGAAFSGIGVYYPDRTPTQQRGIAIDVPCKPTIAGIRAGRDEILECALRALRALGVNE